MHKTLIEEGNFDLIRLFHLVGEEAKKEKNAIPPINEMLYWWTRKPLVVAKMVTLSSTLTDIQTVRDLLGLSKDKRAYLKIPNNDLYKKKLGLEPSNIKVLDPFGGAGNLIFEAKKLGLQCHINDYNPVAYLIMKSVLEYPSKYSDRLIDDVTKYGKELINKVNNEIGKFFVRKGNNSLTYLWVWCIRCPYCDQRMPLVSHMWVLKTLQKKIGIKINVDNNLNFNITMVNGQSEKEGKKFTQKGGKAICIKCRNSIDYKHITNDIAEKRDRELIAIVTKGPHGKNYELPTNEDKQSYLDSIKYLNKVCGEYDKKGWIPHEETRPNRGGDIRKYGIREWSDFYSERQLLVMLTILKNIHEISESISDREYSKVIATYLTLMLCKHVNYNSIGITWHTSKQVIAHALSFRAPRIIYNHAEVNPFEKTSGSLIGIVNDLTRAIKFSSLSKDKCDISLGSVIQLSPKNENKFDLILTDPPYADDVEYGELSELFYVWIYRCLKDFYPELLSRSPIEEDICLSARKFPNKLLAIDWYEKAMSEAFKQIYKALKNDGLLVLFFAHSSTMAWNLLLHVLRDARLRVVSSYAVHTENPANMMAKGKTSFMSSIIVACRKVQEDKTAYFEDILPKIEDKVKNMLRNLSLEELLELPMTDLLIMTYGKVLEETTQHTILKSYRSDFKPEFENLIKDAREFILKEIVTKLTGRTTNVLGSDMSFYLITKTFYRGILDSNEALKIAWAYSIDIEDLVSRGVAKKEIGITSLNFYDEIDLDLKVDEIDKTNLHQQLLYLESIANKEGVIGVKRLVSQYTNFRTQDLKHIINLLIKSYRIRLNKKGVLNGKESKELEIIEGLGDIFNSSIISSSNTLEKFM